MADGARSSPRLCVSRERYELPVDMHRCLANHRFPCGQTGSKSRREMTVEGNINGNSKRRNERKEGKEKLEKRNANERKEKR